MNLVVITAGKRPMLLAQTLRTMVANAVDWKAHRLAVVYDSNDDPRIPNAAMMGLEGTRVISSCGSGWGACVARNVGAELHNDARQKYLTISDDDVYYLPGWDKKISDALDAVEAFRDAGTVLSAVSHPFNLGYGRYIVDGQQIEAASVLSATNMAMPWRIWDTVGGFRGPGGAHSSDDVEWCNRARDFGFGFATLCPNMAIHCGLHSTSGEELVGADMVMEKNRKLEAMFGVEALYE